MCGAQISWSDGQWIIKNPPHTLHFLPNIIAPSGSPEWLAVRCNHPTSVQLFWGAVPEDQQNGVITGYSIQVEGPGTTENIRIATTVSGRMPSIRRPQSLMEDVYTSEEVSDLRPSTEYTFSVSAVTKAGSGPAISVSFITPQEGEASMHTIASTLPNNY